MKVRKKNVSRIGALLMALVMMLSLVPTTVLAAGTADDGLAAAMTKAQNYIDGLTINSSTNNPTTVVSNWGTQFTWDNEKRESASKSYLFEWSYYNGVVFEGLEYMYGATGNAAYNNYVSNYMAAMINGNTTTWKKCSNNSSKDCAGYYAFHGLDCYKTASMLLDYGYTNMAAQLYSDLQNAEDGYSGSNIGYNLYHTWSSTPTYKVWLDGIYMAQPFMAEYAAYINDTAELNRIAQRFAWIGQNMYNSSTGLYYHAANSASDHATAPWSRAIGWYAAALVDVLPYVDNNDMRTQLKRLVDGMLPYQDADGLWHNYVNDVTATSGASRAETSGTALMAYAILKGVNNGWLDASYAQYGIKAFQGICDKKLSSSGLADICIKGSPSNTNGSNNTWSSGASADGKGVGPFIMSYAELLKYEAAQQSTEPEEPVVTEQTATATVGGKEISIATSGAGTISATVSDVTAAYADKLPANLENAVVYDITLSDGYEQGTDATVTLPIPDGVSPDEAVVFYIPEEGEPVQMEGEAADGGYQFVTNHFSAYAIGSLRATDGTAAHYELVTNGVNGIESGEKYLIVSGNNGNVYALNSSGTRVSVRVSDNQITTLSDKTCEFEFEENGSGYNIKDSAGTYLYPTATSQIVRWAYSLSTQSAAQPVTISDGNSAYAVRMYRSVTNIQTTQAYIRANNSSNNATGTATDLYLFKYVPASDPVPGAEVKLTLSPESMTLDTASHTSENVTATVKVADATVGNNTIVWSSSDTTVATVDQSGKVTAVGAGTATITATLSKANNQNLTAPITADITVTVSDVALLVNTGATALNIANDETLDMDYSVRVSGTPTNDYELSWTSSNPGVATVDADGKVTPVAKGTTTIKATLTKADGIVLAQPIVKEVPITVVDLKMDVMPGMSTLNLTDITSKTLKANVTGGNSSDNYTISWKSMDTSVATVDTNGKVTAKKIGEVTIGATLTEVNGVALLVPIMASASVRVVSDTAPIPDYEYDDDMPAAEDYPEYPDEGAVRIHKSAVNDSRFQDSGVTKVELAVAGITAKAGTDVLLIVDVSNSMGWSMQNADQTDDEHRAPTGDQTSKLQDAMTSASNFADILMSGNKPGSETNNTLSFVTFAGYSAKWTKGTNTNDNKCVDSVQTPFVASQDLAGIKKSFNGTTLTYMGTAVTGSWKLTIGDLNGNNIVANDGDKKGGNRGDTNYDYAFYQANLAVEQIKSAYASSHGGKSYDDSGRDIAVIFMTDGAPSHYNGNSASSRYNVDYKPGTTTTYGGRYNDSQALWYNTYMMGGPNTYAETVFPKATGGFYSIGFDMAHGGFSGFQWTEPELKAFMEQMISSNEDHVVLADSTEELMDAYQTIAFKFRNAGEKAQVTDIIDSDFTLQIGNIIGSGSFQKNMTDAGLWGDNSIDVIAYDLYTKNDTSDTNLIGTRKGTSSTLETVTFNLEGTEAYSNLMGSRNIMSKGANGTITIDACYFTYTKDAKGVETFSWKLGSINDKEVALSYFAYLKNSFDQGGAPAGVYNTNEEAKLTYVDVNNCYAEQIFEVPVLAWQGAVTSYEFYLVNAQGQPVNRSGVVVPFANRIILPNCSGSEVINLNTDSDIPAKKIVAKDKLPVGYYLYDNEAYYELTLHSGSTAVENTLDISAPSDDAHKSTKVGNQTITQTGAQTTILLGGEDNNYLQSRVAFGVRFDMSPVPTDFMLKPDTVVVDFGLPVAVNVTANNRQVNGETKDGVAYGIPADSTAPGGHTYTQKLIGFVQYSDGANLAQIMRNPGSETSTLANGEGTFSIEGGKVVFTPEKMMSNVEKVFCVVEITDVTHSSDPITDTYYMYEVLTVIPATIVYYEDSFVQFDNGWQTVGNSTVKKQAEDRPGSQANDANNVYGYDAANASCTTYSMGGAYMAHVGEDDMPEAKFTFTGTAFDVISLTSNTCGTMFVDVIGKDNGVKEYWVVDNYYGYSSHSQDGFIKQTWTYGEDNQWHVKQEKVPTKGVDGTMPSSPTVGSSFVLYTPNHIWVRDNSANNALYQIPVIKSPELPYGTYDVTIYSFYSNFFDHTGAGSYDVYLDAIRVYNPVDDAEADAAYAADHEADPEFAELRNKLLDADAFAVDGADKEGVMFIDGFHNISDENGNTNYDETAMEDFLNYGPNNEVYLQPGQSVAFTLESSNVDRVHLGVKALNAQARISVGAVNGSNKPSITTNSALDMYYDITAIAQPGNIVVITNTGSNMVSLTNIKVTHTQAPAAPMRLMMSAPAARMAETYASTLYLAAVPVEQEVENPEVIQPADPAASEEKKVDDAAENAGKDDKADESGKSDKFKPEKMDVTVDKDDIKVGDEVTVSIKTSQDVAAVTVNGEDAKLSATDSVTGEETWTFAAKADEVGDMTNSVVAFDKSGNASEVVDSTGTVQEKEHRTLGQIIMSFIQWIINWVSGWFKG